MASRVAARVTTSFSSPIAKYALTSSRTRSEAYAAGHASSKSFTPQTSRPSRSRQVPKLSTCKIADSQHLRSARQFRTNNWPQPRPTIERRTHERENRIGHHAMLQNQIAAHNRNLLRLPPLQIQSSSKDRWQILYGRLDRFHLIERSLPCSTQSCVRVF